MPTGWRPGGPAGRVMGAYACLVVHRVAWAVAAGGSVGGDARICGQARTVSRADSSDESGTDPLSYTRRSSGSHYTSTPARHGAARGEYVEDMVANRERQNPGTRVPGSGGVFVLP